MEAPRTSTTDAKSVGLDGPPVPISMVWTIGLGLALLTLVLYWPALEHDFVDFDDGAYVFQNETIKQGVTWDGLRWAFTRLHGEHTYWHPVTWVSHMLDVEWFGLNPMGHHLISLVWHAANVVLLYALILRLGQPLWAAVLVAGLFGWHPLQVDAVAWVAERKALLSMFFWLLATWTYVRYTEVPKTGRLVVSVGLYALGLMCKPILVTLPCALLLLDVWPLRRIKVPGLEVAVRAADGPGWGRVLGEKAPYFLLAGISSVITVVGHSRLESLGSVSGSPLGHRVGMAIISYATYLKKFVWPNDLAVYYPYRDAFDPWELGLCALVVAGLTAFSLAQLRRRPVFAVGWFWFLGVLFPTVGIVQAGPQWMADRFFYHPAIGLGIFWAGALAVCLREYPRCRPGVGAAAAVTLGVMILVSRAQLKHWENTLTLFTRAAVIIPNNPLILALLGSGYYSVGDDEQAESAYRKSLALNPKLFNAHLGLAGVQMRRRQYQSAAESYRAALESRSDLLPAISGLGIALCQLGRHREALPHLVRATVREPKSPENHYNLGLAYEKLGNLDEAKTSFLQALALAPTLVDAYRALSTLYLNLNQPVAAADALRKGLAKAPDSIELLNSLAWLLATHPSAAFRNGPEALICAQRARVLDGSNSPRSSDALGAALAEVGRHGEAAATIRQILIQLPPDAPVALRLELDQRLSLYLAGKAFRSESGGVPASGSVTNPPVRSTPP